MSYNIKRIDCSNRNLNNTSVRFPDCPDAKELDFSQNNIRSLDDLTLPGNLQQTIYTINFAYNQIDRIDMDLFMEFPYLLRLNLTNNRLGAAERRSSGYLKK